RTPSEKSYSRSISLFLSRAFLITPAFASASESRANDADILASFCMHDNKQFPTMRSADNDKTVFHRRMNRIGNGQRTRISENREPSSKLISCFAKLAFAFFASHSKLRAMIESLAIN